MTKSFSALQIIFGISLWLTMPSIAASPEFQASYEKLLQELDSGFPGKEPGYYGSFIAKEFDNLSKLASREELGDAIALTLANPQKRELWIHSLSISSMLGPQFDRSKIVAAIKKNLGYYFVLDEVKNLAPGRLVLINSASYELCYYGTEDDVELVKSFAAKAAKVNPGLAQSLEFTIFNRTRVLELRARAANADSASMQDRQAQTATQASQNAQPPPAPSVEKASPTPSKEQASSMSRLLVVVVIVAVLGLMWLLFKRRK